MPCNPCGTFLRYTTGTEFPCNHNVCFERFAVTISDSKATLDRKFLSFFSVSYTSCLLHRASSDTISIPSAEAISFHAFFLFGQF